MAHVWTSAPILTPLLFCVLAILFQLQASAQDLSDRSKAQIRILSEEKARRTPTERKLDSKLLFTCRLHRGELPAPGISRWNRETLAMQGEQILVDLVSDVAADVFTEITARGGRVVSAFPQHRALRCWIPIHQIERLAAHPRIHRIRPAAEATTNSGPINSDGDTTHQADIARVRYAVGGEGLKIGVLSDSVTFLADSQAKGELPFVNVIPGQAGTGSGEGTAMLELIHDLAPKAELYFATAFNSSSSFAENIRALKSAGCEIIVDDVTYFNESPFQDGVIAQAVNEVSASGALYFSSAGNSGNKSDGTAAVWEGDFVDGGPATYGRGGRLHNFGGSTFNTILAGSSSRRLDLFWTDPLGKSANDYDVYLLDAAGSVVSSSTNIQDGNDDPYENISTLGSGERVVIVKFSGADRFLWLGTGRAALSINTQGSVRGHNASGAANALSVAATWVRSPAVPFLGGAANSVERFSSGGPRRIFYAPDGSAITPGNLTATGGTVLAKPDITAADGSHTSVTGFETFFGTSAAAPHAAAIAALVWSYNRSLSASQVKQLLLDTALDIEGPGVDADSGHGIVMTPAAIESSPSPKPNLGAEFPQIVGGNGNPVLDANECVQLFFELRNRIGTRGDAATAVVATLRSLTPGVSTDPAPISFPDIPAGQSVSNTTPFLISTGPNFPCGSPAVFELTLRQSNQGAGTQQFTLPTSSTTIGIPISFQAASVPLPIPDLTSVESEVAVSGFDLPVAEVSVSLHLLHPYLSDLVVDLVAPDGTVVNLSTRNGSSGDNFGTSCNARTVFSDASPNRLVLGAAPFVGSFAPDQPLSSFRGKVGVEVNGIWKLRIADVAEPDAGSLVCWTLQLSPIQCQDAGGPCFQPPLITAQPESISVTEGSSATFRATVIGTAPLAHQWYFQGTNRLSGATSPILTLSNASSDSAGYYTLVVTNRYGSVTSTPALFTLAPRPFIVTQPADLLAVVSSDVALSVQAQGPGPISYQWFRLPNTAIPSATQAILLFSPAGVSDTGDYRVEISNVFGSVTSRVAHVDIGIPASISVGPSNITTNQGKTVQFSVIASGSSPLTYQWYFNENTPLAGATSSTLTLNAVTAAQGGTYRVVVSNRFGSANSSEALLNVIVPNNLPSISLTKPTDGSQLVATHLPVLLSATAQDSDGSIRQVEFLVDARPLISVSSPPYEHTWIDPSPGQHRVQAIATDNLGGRATSAVSTITVTLPQDHVAFLISTGSIWRYLDDGSDQGSRWEQSLFNDSGWKEGAAKLGYGDPPETTPIDFGPDTENKYITYYFRHRFYVEDAPSYTNLLVRLQRDDGAAVYLNGTEAFRSNLPDGLLNYRTLASQVVSGVNESTFFPTNIAPDLLQDGWNTLAVEVHQTATNSTDVSFNLELTGLRSLSPRIIEEPESLTVFAGQKVEFRVSVRSAAPVFYRWFYNTSHLIQASESEVLTLTNLTVGASGAYSVVVSNAFGKATSLPAQLSVLPVFTNRPPTIVLTSPSPGSVLGNNIFPVAVRAAATDPDSDPLTVQFLLDGERLVTLTQSPFEFSWVDPKPGQHRLQAIVTDDAFLSTTSAVVEVTIQAPSTTIYSLIPSGSVWKYDDRGLDLGQAWTAVEFSEAGWKQGPAELGYGDSGDGRPEATLIGFGNDPNDRFPTAYFRKGFVMTDPTDFNVLRFHILRDDGLVVHLNGETLFHDNMAEGLIRFTNYAQTAINGAAETILLERVLTNAPLRRGLNVLAVEVHQSGPRSSDLSFDLALDAARSPRPTILSQPESLTVSNGLNASFSIVAEGAPILRYQWWLNATNLVANGTNATLLLRSVTPSAAGDYSCEVRNDYGTVMSRSARLTVVSPQQNQPPFIRVTSPAPNSVFAFGSPTLLSVEASDADGQVARVDFLLDGKIIGSLDQAPYRLDWIEGTPGEHELTALATDNLGLTSLSTAVRITVSPPPPLTTSLIATGSVWRYSDTGIDQGSKWRLADFNDRTWSLGKAILGYGNAPKGRPEATVLNSGNDPNQRIPTYYFRQHFVVTNLASITRLIFRTLRDDGVRVYLNGVNVFRDNLPSGSTSFSTLANTAVTGADETVYLTNLVSAAGAIFGGVVEGDNVIAAEVHQVSRASDDIAFDMSLQAEVNSQPIIVAQPVSQTSTNGGTASFRVVAYGTGTLTYQWYLNGTNLLSNRTQPTLTLTNLRTSQAGRYSVQIQNAFGSVRSTQATLTVLVVNPNLPPVVSLISPTNSAVFRQGDVIPIQASATDSDGRVAYLDIYDQTNRLTRLTNSPYFYDWTTALEGPHVLRGLAVDNKGATNFSAPISISVVGLPNPPGASTTLISTGAVWKYLDTGVDQGVAWRNLAFNDSGWSNGLAQLGYGDNDEATVIRFGSSGADKYPTYYFRRGFAVENAASFQELTVSLLRDDGGVVYLNGVEIFRSNMPTGAIAFSTRASSAVDKVFEGVFYETNAAPSLLREGTNVLAVEIHQAGPGSSDVSFDLRLTGLALTVPSIETNPVDQHIPLGGTATFAVRASGADPLRYQWYQNGLTPLPGATNSTLVIRNIQASEEASYSVVVANRFGETKSDSAVLRVIFPPKITLQPSDQNTPLSSRVEFRVEASGSPPLSYQWFYNQSSVILNATNSALVLLSVQPGDAGAYSVRVSNLADSTLSRAARLTVGPGQPSVVITAQPQDVTLLSPGPASFRVTATGTPPLSYQWFLNGATNIPGATSNVFFLPNAGVANMGTYSVRVANATSSAISQAAELKILIKPSITSLIVSSNTVSLSFTSVSRLRYTVESSTTMTSPNWTPVTGAVLIKGTGNAVTVPDPSSRTGIRFYRVRVE